MKKQAFAIAFLMVLLCLFSGCASQNSTPPTSNENTSASAISFLDDDGNQITLQEPCKKIISLYSAHTENLYSLGAGDALIGSHETAIYPPEAAFLPKFDYNADPETIIAAEPDLVLIRPFISRKNPSFVEALQKAGITVVSLYPDTYEEFDDYIKKLAQLTGTEEIAEEKLSAFHEEINTISNLTAKASNKQKIFFESTDVEVRTVTPDSLPGVAIQFAGGINIASDATAISKGSSIASFGEEKVLAVADDIDVYVSQRGAMNSGGNLHTITSRPGFHTISAVKNGKVYTINEKIISSPTFRYSKGVKELARYLYPDIIDALEDYQNDTLATKRSFANILVKFNHLPIYIPSSSGYYTENHKGHTYGLFQDVPWTDEDFDAIETATIGGLIPWEKEGDSEIFSPDAPITKETVAKAIFILYDLPSSNHATSISDISQCENANIVQCIVDNGILPLTNSKFEPNQTLTNQEVLSALEKAIQVQKK